MELRTHLGILILLVISMLITWVISPYRLNKFKWCIPINIAVAIFLVFEIIHGVIVLCFL